MSIFGTVSCKKHAMIWLRRFVCVLSHLKMELFLWGCVGSLTGVTLLEEGNAGAQPLPPPAS